MGCGKNIVGSLAVYWTPKLVLKGPDSIFSGSIENGKHCIEPNPVGWVRDGSHESRDLLLPRSLEPHWPPALWWLIYTPACRGGGRKQRFLLKHRRPWIRHPRPRGAGLYEAGPFIWPAVAPTLYRLCRAEIALWRRGKRTIQGLQRSIYLYPLLIRSLLIKNH